MPRKRTDIQRGDGHFSPPGRGSIARRRLLGASAAATALVLTTATPAAAWGSVTLAAPTGCTGQAYGQSWTSSNGGVLNATTYEGGNWCPFGRTKVSVGFWQAYGGTNPVFVYSAYDEASLSGTQQGAPPGHYRRGYHSWGSAAYS